VRLLSAIAIVGHQLLEAVRLTTSVSAPYTRDPPSWESGRQVHRPSHHYKARRCSALHGSQSCGHANVTLGIGHRMYVPLETLPSLIRSPRRQLDEKRNLQSCPLPNPTTHVLLWNTISCFPAHEPRLNPHPVSSRRLISSNILTPGGHHCNAYHVCAQTWITILNPPA
jgi:hypothetical protein